MERSQDGFIPGDPWCICDRCGFKMRHSEGKLTWDGFFVCDADWEEKHPQLSPPPKNYGEGKPFPNCRPEPEDTFIDTSLPPDTSNL